MSSLDARPAHVPPADHSRGPRRFGAAPDHPAEAGDAPFTVPHLAPIAAAIRAVGIPVRHGAVAGNLLPGVMIDRGTLVVDEGELRFAGDVLHEAGHIAVLPPQERARVAGTLPKEGGEEMAALAWSYAMAVAFALPLEVVFHDEFKAGGPWLRETFTAGHWLGAPLLQCWDMTRAPNSPPGFEHLPVFPKMARWLREFDWPESPSDSPPPGQEVPRPARPLAPPGVPR